MRIGCTLVISYGCPAVRRSFVVVVVTRSIVPTDLLRRYVSMMIGGYERNPRVLVPFGCRHPG
ncbi:MAG: hypothetical protein BGO89_10715 [Candidatus Kapaibacterium thiocyanatum]|uniref:Uncharacterized protein n=1 Tax=Candidatus Kapaibacterium thiocyanatum TaxID=1895771 RepID=A0A1M3KX81_9BACT|nr:MAG: hypothetical protein BGO89_10715 ['Candidatus Kapabacteria' thiocyanatum]